jgi:hypothetical protein
VVAAAETAVPVVEGGEPVMTAWRKIANRLSSSARLSYRQPARFP